jgi:hypothetical protein
MCDVEHDGVRSPPLNEGSQLILKVFGLLSSQSRHRICSAKTLSRHPMTGFAILDLGLKVLTPYDAALYRSTWAYESDCKNRRQRQFQADDFHDPASIKLLILRETDPL